MRLLSLGLDWNVDFDFTFPNWALSSLIGIIDALVSAGVDLYFFAKTHLLKEDDEDEDMADRVENLEDPAMEAAENLDDRMQVHRSVMCDDCAVIPIRGTRFHCVVGKHDYCRRCRKKNKGTCPIDGAVLCVYGERPEQHP
jgi:hypothetical protein